MKKIAYFSPLNPIRSGISDYSEDLLPELAKTYEIEVYVENGFQPQNTQLSEKCVIRNYAEFSRRFAEKQYSAILYHMGNNYSAHQKIYEFILKYPGIVVLHDYSLHHFFAAKTLEKGDLQAYRDEMLYCHGQEALNEVNRFLSGEIPPIWEGDSISFPLNLRILDHSTGIIVHSNFAKNLLQKQASYVPINVVPIPAPYISKFEDLEIEKENARVELGIDQNDFVISALGYANPTKRIDKIIEAVALIKAKRSISNLKFYIVGEISPNYPIKELIKKYKVTDEVVCTGYVDLKVFDKYIAASDICINLRYPTQGENSASLLKIMGHGKPVITTNIGSFKEFPDNLVFKVGFGASEVNEIIEAILKIIGMDRKGLSSEILDFVMQFNSMNVCAEKYISTLNLLTLQQCNIMLGLNSYLSKFITEVSQKEYYMVSEMLIEKTIGTVSRVFRK
ncbi:glycosyltransferase family 4 protein [Paenibacillus fonticola]|uniref:glycosyltransferase family 4 protein n=1 Tax=Paenibacillus fonticola TaxID=379896 RepID=UPI000363155B|nr:glycosyltransferase family 4 protein [Paenibacillus fonticola]